MAFVSATRIAIFSDGHCFVHRVASVSDGRLLGP